MCVCACVCVHVCVCMGGEGQGKKNGMFRDSPIPQCSMCFKLGSC